MDGRYPAAVETGVSLDGTGLWKGHKGQDPGSSTFPLSER